MAWSADAHVVGLARFVPTDLGIAGGPTTELRREGAFHKEGIGVAFRIPFKTFGASVEQRP